MLSVPPSIWWYHNDITTPCGGRRARQPPRPRTATCLPQVSIVILRLFVTVQRSVATNHRHRRDKEGRSSAKVPPAFRWPELGPRPPPARRRGHLHNRAPSHEHMQV